MNENNQIKVCIVTISLGKGGAERSTAMLSRMLDSQGFDVHLVILTNSIDYEYAGTLFNLGELKEKSNSVFGRFIRFKKLRRYLVSQNFDFIIDNRNRQFAKTELFYLNYVYKGFNPIYVVRSFKLEQYFPKKKSVAKKMIKRSFKIVGVSQAIAEEINRKYKTQKAIAIYNPIAPLPDKIVDDATSSKYIIFLGRLVEDVKNFSLLLEAYKRSDLPEKNIELKILGDGPDKELIQRKIELLQLENIVHLIPFTPAIKTYLERAKFLVLTSHYEGFPRVLIEALSVGTPVVSVDCNSGPREIIIHKKNGLLVENHNTQALSEAMNTMISNEELYIELKSYAKESVQHLEMSNIASQWSKLVQHA
ncbi:glycosyltransferase [Jejudonia soesokkakensis]|uniref:Glycosyltransferase n=1 Tax=Jejudonia soesokkakensis TaxID=1323432 RepID=A0ABW2MVR8_9FLAO